LGAVGSGVLVVADLFPLCGLITLVQAARLITLRRTKGIVAAVFITLLPQGLFRRYLLANMIIARMLASILIAINSGPLAMRKLYMSMWSIALSSFYLLYSYLMA
jgi:hypothetical protein